MGHPIHIDPISYILWAVILLTLPLDWIGAMVLAAAVHELCHMAAVRLTGGRIRSIRIGSAGTVITAELPGRGAELLCAAAGPLGSLLLCLFFRWIPKIALCGFVHGIFNFMPVYPLDGGQIIRCIAGAKVGSRVEQIFLILLGTAALGISVRFRGEIWAVLFAVSMIASVLARKRPCKRSRKRVQ